MDINRMTGKSDDYRLGYGTGFRVGRRFQRNVDIGRESAAQDPYYHIVREGQPLCGKPDAPVVDHECPECNRIEWARVCEPIR